MKTQKEGTIQLLLLFVPEPLQRNFVRPNKLNSFRTAEDVLKLFLELDLAFDYRKNGRVNWIVFPLFEFSFPKNLKITQDWSFGTHMSY
jgi:hypothetical protein